MIYGLVLAGGRSRRFGREKALAEVGGLPLIERVAEVLAHGCAHVAINARPDTGAGALARAHGLTLVVDEDGDAEGPLAGIKAGLAWARYGGADRLVTAPCDTPFVPHDLAPRLAKAMGEARAAVACTTDGLQPTCAIWRLDAAEAVASALAEARHPPLRKVLTALGAVEVPFHASDFMNVNTPDEHTRAEARARDEAAQITRINSRTTTITTTRPRPPEG